MVLSIPPTSAVATVVGQLKGSSSHALARMPEGDGFRWQEEYGVLSFGRRNLSQVARYVNDQERRHAQRDPVPDLERTGDALSARNHDGAAPAARSAGLSRLRERRPVIDDRAMPRVQRRPVLTLHDLDHMPALATEAEEAAFWDEHDLGPDVLERMGPLSDWKHDGAGENHYARDQ